MSEVERAIIHLDLDAFFASVEALENPELAGQPIIVGGRPEGRGVVAAASYAARAFGVRSAMPTVRALSLCPQAIVVPPRHRLYSEYGRRVMAILRETCSQVERTSIDEAYLDLTEQLARWDDAVQVATELQSRVGREVGLSSSLGVAGNKLVAKVASDFDKPSGLTVVRPGEEAGFLSPLPVRVLWGIGPVTARRLAAMGVTTVGDLARLPETALRQQFGRHGSDMLRHAHGVDHRPVLSTHELKSVSQERTFARDISDPQALHEQLQELGQSVGRRLRSLGMAAGTVGIKLRYADFTTLNRQVTLVVPTDADATILQAAGGLFDRAWKPGRPVRLLGVSARRLSPSVGQLAFW